MKFRHRVARGFHMDRFALWVFSIGALAMAGFGLWHRDTVLALAMSAVFVLTHVGQVWVRRNLPPHTRHG